MTALPIVAWNSSTLRAVNALWLAFAIRPTTWAGFTSKLFSSSTKLLSPVSIDRAFLKPSEIKMGMVGSFVSVRYDASYVLSTE